jgi:hypothetical protein
MSNLSQISANGRTLRAGNQKTRVFKLPHRPQTVRPCGSISGDEGRAWGLARPDQAIPQIAETPRAGARLDDLGLTRDQMLHFVQKPAANSNRPGQMAAILGLITAEAKRDPAARVALSDALAPPYSS